VGSEIKILAGIRLAGYIGYIDNGTIGQDWNNSTFLCLNESRVFRAIPQY